MRPIALNFVFLALTGCTSSWIADPAKPHPPAQTISVAVHGPGVPLELHWFRNSAERRALYAQIYSQATQSVTALAKEHSPNSWAVILDVDETILDNSEYQARLAISGQGYNTETWDAWVHEKKAVALPGVASFIHSVMSDLHGRVVLVTNRSMADCPDTIANLHEQAIDADDVLCAPNGQDGKPISDKNPRFADVTKGATKLGKLDVLAYVGDNIQDFPGLTQSNPGDASRFGKDYFILPNPMYGSWVGNVYR